MSKATDEAGLLQSKPLKAYCTLLIRFWYLRAFTYSKIGQLNCLRFQRRLQALNEVLKRVKTRIVLTLGRFRGTLFALGQGL